MLLDEITDFVDLVFGELLIFRIEQGCDEVLRFSLKERAQQALEGGALGFSFGNGRSVKIASPFLGMFHHFLVFQGGEEGADGGIGGRIGEFFLHVLGGGFTEAVEDVQDLPFPAGERPFFQSIHKGTLVGAEKPAI